MSSRRSLPAVLVVAVAAASAFAGCSQTRDGADAGTAATAAAAAASSGSARAGGQGEAGMTSIGTATMDPDGTIVLLLRATGSGVVGDGRITYPPSHPEYQSVLKHLGGLRPGESKPVPPWPD